MDYWSTGLQEEWAEKTRRIYRIAIYHLVIYAARFPRVGKQMGAGCTSTLRGSTESPTLRACFPRLGTLGLTFFKPRNRTFKRLRPCRRKFVSPPCSVMHPSDRSRSGNLRYKPNTNGLPPRSFPLIGEGLLNVPWKRSKRI